MRVQSEFTKTNPQFFFKKGGAAPGAPVLDPPLHEPGSCLHII